MQDEFFILYCDMDSDTNNDADNDAHNVPPLGTAYSVE